MGAAGRILWGAAFCLAILKTIKVKYLVFKYLDCNNLMLYRSQTIKVITLKVLIDKVDPIRIENYNNKTSPMRIFHPINSLVVSRNLWLILLSKI